MEPEELPRLSFRLTAFTRNQRSLSSSTSFEYFLTDKIESEHFLEYFVNFRMAGNFKHRGAMNVLLLRHVKHRLRSVVDYEHLALWIQHQDTLDHAAQNRIGLFLFIDDLSQVMADPGAHVVEIL